MPFKTHLNKLDKETKFQDKIKDVHLKGKTLLEKNNNLPEEIVELIKAQNELVEELRIDRDKQIRQKEEFAVRISTGAVKASQEEAEEK